MKLAIPILRWNKCRLILSSAELSTHSSPGSPPRFSRKNIRLLDRGKRQRIRLLTRWLSDSLSHSLGCLRHSRELIAIIGSDQHMWRRCADFLETVTLISRKMTSSLRTSRKRSTDNSTRRDNWNPLSVCQMPLLPRLLSPRTKRWRLVSMSIRDYLSWSSPSWKNSSQISKRMSSSRISSTEWCKSWRLRAMMRLPQSRDRCRPHKRYRMLSPIWYQERTYSWYPRIARSRMRDIFVWISMLIFRIWILTID